MEEGRAARKTKGGAKLDNKSAKSRAKPILTNIVNKNNRTIALNVA
jgi:hypothetical protein